MREDPELDSYFSLPRYPVDDCDQARLFICCDPCTGATCGTSSWACDNAAENSEACQNRMRFLKTILIEN